jgi:hypothetical protein
VAKRKRTNFLQNITQKITNPATRTLLKYGVSSGAPENVPSSQYTEYIYKKNKVPIKKTDNVQYI